MIWCNVIYNLGACYNPNTKPMEAGRPPSVKFNWRQIIEFNTLGILICHRGQSLSDTIWTTVHFSFSQAKQMGMIGPKLKLKPFDRFVESKLDGRWWHDVFQIDNLKQRQNTSVQTAIRSRLKISEFDAYVKGNQISCLKGKHFIPCTTCGIKLIWKHLIDAIVETGIWPCQIKKFMLSMMSA